MSNVPRGENQLFPDPDLMESYPGVYITMGLTAENMAQRYGVSRENEDAFALNSRQKAVKALKGEKFAEQILPLKIVERTFEEGKPVKNF